MGTHHFAIGVLSLPAFLSAGALGVNAPRWAFGLATVLSVAALAPICRRRPSAGLPKESPA